MAIEDGELFCKMIIIDTNMSSGNFERELCAYATGQIAECNVGSELAELAQEEIKHLSWWEDNISQQEDEDGSEFYRPCTIWKTPGINLYGDKIAENVESTPPAYCSVAIFVEEFPPQEVLDEMLERVKKFCNNPYNLYKENDFYNPEKFKGYEKLELTGYRFLDPEVKQVMVPKDEVISVTTKSFKF